MNILTPEMLLRAYAIGVFPMADSRDSTSLFWVNPEMRGIIPLDDFRVSRSLCKTLRRGVFEVRCDTAFDRVVAGCAAPGPGRAETWINAPIAALCSELFASGFAHSVECWREGELVGGLYGIALGGAFFGESMFSRTRDASKAALVHLVARLRLAGFTLLDTQFVTGHLERFGAREIPRARYLELLERAIKIPVRFPSAADDGAVRAELEVLFRGRGD